MISDDSDQWKVMTIGMLKLSLAGWAIQVFTTAGCVRPLQR